MGWLGAGVRHLLRQTVWGCLSAQECGCVCVLKQPLLVIPGWTWISFSSKSSVKHRTTGDHSRWLICGAVLPYSSSLWWLFFSYPSVCIPPLNRLLQIPIKAPWMNGCLWLRLSTGFDQMSLYLQKSEGSHVSTRDSTQHDDVFKFLGEFRAKIAISQWFDGTNSNNKPGTPDGADLSKGPIWLEDRAKHFEKEKAKLGRKSDRASVQSSPVERGDLYLPAQLRVNTNICHTLLVLVWSKSCLHSLRVK